MAGAVPFQNKFKLIHCRPPSWVSDTTPRVDESCPPERNGMQPRHFLSYTNPTAMEFAMNRPHG